jgi:uncharacterized RDD family membrane protein YckC
VRNGLRRPLAALAGALWLCTATAGQNSRDLASSDARPSILAGNAEALWLVRPDDEGRYGLVVRPAGEPWEWAAQQLTRKKLSEPPAAAVAVGNQLHLLLRDPRAYQVYSPDGQRTIAAVPSHDRWPPSADPVALCDAQGLRGAGAGSIAAVVPVKSAPATAPTQATTGQTVTTQPTTAPTAPAGSALAAFQRRRGRWEYLGAVPAGPPQGGRVFAAVADGRMYVLLSPAMGGGNRLFVLEDQWSEAPLTGPAATADCAGMLSLADRPRMVLSAPAEDAEHRRILLAAWDYGRGVTLQPVRVAGEDVTLAAGALLLAARLGDQVALLSEEDGVLALTTCDANGQAVPQGTLDVFEQPPPGHGGPKVLNYFMWGIVIAIFVPLFFMRPKSPPKPFTLPDTVRPGPLLKRLAAGLIDLLPFYLLGSLLLLPQWPADKARSMDDVMEFAREYGQTADAAYIVMSTTLLYVAYCVFMELRFRATLGKMALGLRVCGDEAGPPDVRGVLLRNLFKIIELFWPLGIPVLLLWPVFNANRQRLGDLLGRTAVIDTRHAPPQRPPDETRGYEQGPPGPPPPPSQDEGDEQP